MMRNSFAAVMLLGTVTTAMAAVPVVQFAPMHSHGPNARYPRLIAFPDKAVQRKVNVLLAGEDAGDAEARSNCLSSLKDSPIKPTADSYSVDIRVRYVSRNLASLDVRESSYCGGAYPNEGMPDPLTVDLRSGNQVDWKKIFKPGFLPDQSGSGTAKLVSLYRARYARQPNIIDGCLDAVNGAADSWALRLDAARGGLVVTPQFPHVAEACARDIALPTADIAPYVADRAFLADLRQTVHKVGQ